MKASNIKSGMIFWDGSLITVISETKCFIVASLANGEGMEGKSVEVKWNKNSVIRLAA